MSLTGAGSPTTYGLQHRCSALKASMYMYRGTSLMRHNTPLGPYSRTMPMALWWS